MKKYRSTKVIELGSCAFRQPRAESHCRFIHGYQLYAKFWFECSELDSNNWVVDFGGLKDLKKILRGQFDHTTCISSDDPLMDDFLNLHERGGCDLRIMSDGIGIEKFAEWCYKQTNHFISKKTRKRCWLIKVEVFEHSSNSGIYVEGEGDLNETKNQ